MPMYRIVNIKQGMPNCDYAVFVMEKEIEFAKKEGCRVLVFIHGYGSKGYGGAIKKEVDTKLRELKKYKKIIDYVTGDKWTDTSDTVKLIYKYAPELSISDQVSGINSGVTVVLIYE